MQSWQVIVIIVIYDIAKSLCTEYLNWKNEQSSTDTEADENEEIDSEEKLIKDYTSKYLIDELSKMPFMVISTAYLYAINYTSYGEDVTEKWLTATQQNAILEKAYEKGYYDALNDTIKCDQIKRGE